jgi:hypothetical protein
MHAGNIDRKNIGLNILAEMPEQDFVLILA